MGESGLPCAFAATELATNELWLTPSLREITAKWFPVKWFWNNAVDERQDRELIDAYRRGQEEAAAVLFDRYYQRLRAMAVREKGWDLREVDTASDIVQSALRNFFRRIRSDQKPLEASGDEGLWPYLVTLTLNKIRNRVQYWQRHRRRAQVVSLESASDPIEHAPDAEAIASTSETIDNLLGAFPARRQAILKLLLQGYTSREIALTLGTTERTVYNTRQAACKVLDQLLEKQADPE